MFPELMLYVEEFRQNFRLVDAVDIMVIALLLYAGLVWFKQTASHGVVIGAALVTALYFLALTFDMYLTSLVFHAAFAVLLIVLVVLFQEEIRRVFERVAGWGTLRELRPKTAVLNSEIDTLVETAFMLASQKTGAIIVLCGREPLSRHINGGIELSGKISKPILNSIFDASSAGHDGAVIIHRDRIEKFSVHLPISKNHKEIGSRGTRHSAALGLSECSDALTIVVSEERGTVSIAQLAKLTVLSSAADLKHAIEHFIEDRFPQKLETTWKRFILHDIRWKLLALILSITAWFVLAYDVEKIQTSVVVPIEYRNLPDHAKLDESTPAEALVTLSGSERAFRLFDRRVLKISLDISKHATANGSIPIRAGDVRVPPNLNVVRIQPSEIQMHLELPMPAPAPTTSPTPITTPAPAPVIEPDAN